MPFAQNSHFRLCFLRIQFRVTAGGVCRTDSRSRIHELSLYKPVLNASAIASAAYCTEVAGLCSSISEEHLRSEMT